eukprot:5901998-Alexandrium_andersonii.AAC.1
MFSPSSASKRDRGSMITGHSHEWNDRSGRAQKLQGHLQEAAGACRKPLPAGSCRLPRLSCSSPRFPRSS